MKNIEIKPLLEKDYDEFRKLTTHHIGLWYDDIDESFAENIIISHKLGEDPVGYFTKRKIIYGGYLNGEMIGFLVATEKRGGSVKLAPGIIKDKYQNLGYFKKIWQELENIYIKKGFRKIYNTGPIDRKELVNLVISFGLEIEAQLKEHYRKNQDDYVVGKVINKEKFYMQDNKIEIGFYGHKNQKYNIRVLKDHDFEEVKEFLISKMSTKYDDIDESFVRSIFDATKRFEDTFKQKGKYVLVLEVNNKISGIIVGTPKRGGSVKLVPLIINEKNVNSNMIKDLVDEIENIFREMCFRKLYLIQPIDDIHIINLMKSIGFRTEGLLKEPYKANVDNIIISKFISD